MTQDILPQTLVKSAISIADSDDTRSLINLVPPALAEAISTLAFEKPELLNRDEKELYDELRAINKAPSPTDNRIRIKFWMEYDRVQTKGESKMGIINVISGLASKEFFYTRYLKNQTKLAWLLCPPTGYMIKAKEALEFGIDQLRDILAQPHVIQGKVDVRLGALKEKIVARLENRVEGALMQRQMNLNVHTGNDEVAKAVTAATMEDLERQLKDLDRKSRLAQNIPLSPAEKALSGKPDIEIEPS